VQCIINKNVVTFILQDEWPQNALTFAQILLKVCKKLQEESFSGGFHVPAELVNQV
jgi:hypothetical protein